MTLDDTTSKGDNPYIRFMSAPTLLQSRALRFKRQYQGKGKVILFTGEGTSYGHARQRLSSNNIQDWPSSIVITSFSLKSLRQIEMLQKEIAGPGNLYRQVLTTSTEAGERAFWQVQYFILSQSNFHLHLLGVDTLISCGLCY